MFIISSFIFDAFDNAVFDKPVSVYRRTQFSLIVDNPYLMLVVVVLDVYRAYLIECVLFRRVIVFKTRYLRNRQLRNVGRDELAYSCTYLTVTLLNLIEYLAFTGLDRINIELIYRIPDIRTKRRAVDRNAVHSAFELYIDAAVYAFTSDCYVSCLIRLDLVSVYQTVRRQPFADSQSIAD